MHLTMGFGSRPTAQGNAADGVCLTSVNHIGIQNERKVRAILDSTVNGNLLANCHCSTDRSMHEYYQGEERYVSFILC